MNAAQALQARILGIIATIVAAVENWKAPTNLGNIVSDVGVLVTGVQAIDPNAIPATLGKEITSIPAEFAAVSGGSVAILGDFPASFDGQADDIMLFGVRKYNGGSAPAGSQAETIKNLLGT